MALSFTGPYPSGYGVFSPNFQEPPIPKVATELRGHFMQHKWNAQVSHIASGYWYNSAQNGKVRVDETYDGAFGSSLFDFTNISPDGGVRNHQVIVGPSVDSKPQCFNDFVQAPGFPLITADFLRSANASFGGVVQEPLLGVAQTWDFLFAGSIPVIVYLNTDAVLLGYDFWGEDQRTKVVTRFFAQQVGPISAEVFQDFSCSEAEERQGEGKRKVRGR